MWVQLYVSTLACENNCTWVHYYVSTTVREYINTQYISRSLYLSLPFPVTIIFVTGACTPPVSLTCVIQNVWPPNLSSPKEGLRTYLLKLTLRSAKSGLGNSVVKGSGLTSTQYDTLKDTKQHWTVMKMWSIKYVTTVEDLFQCPTRYLQNISVHIRKDILVSNGEIISVFIDDQGTWKEPAVSSQSLVSCRLWLTNYFQTTLK